MGWPLWLLAPITYSFLSQSPGTSFSTPVSLNVAGLSASSGLSEEEHPLVVGSPSHSFQVVVGRMIPTVTVSSSAAEMTLSALPTTAPRVSTSCANVAGRDVCRVIQQHPHSSPNRVLAGAGVGRGQILAKKLTKTGGGRGQILVKKLAEAGIGRGQSFPSSQVKKPEEGRGHTDACTSANLPPPVTMNLDHQGPPVTYSEVASRPPQRVTTSPDELEMCNVRIKVAAHEWEKEATWATFNWIRQQEWDEQATQRKEKECKLWRVHQCEAGCKLAKEGAQQQEEYNHEQRPPELVLIPSLIPWDGVNMSGPERTSTRVPHGLGTYGVPAPWAISNWPWGWSAHGALLRLTSRPSKVFTFAHLHPHILEAYNHKVSHDTHKELNLQECAVLQYARALQYVSYCNDASYRDTWAPSGQRLLGGGCQAFWKQGSPQFR